MCLLPFLYGSIYEGNCEGGTQSGDFSSQFPLTFYRTQERKCILKETWKEKQNEYDQEYWATFFFFNSSSQFLLSPALCLSRPYKIHLYCHIHRMRWWSPDSHMHTYLTENINAFHVFGGGLEIWRWMFHVETSSFLVSQVFRNKARLPESHAELNGWWEEEHKKWDVGLQLKTFWITAIIFSYLF